MLFFVGCWPGVGGGGGTLCTNVNASALVHVCIHWSQIHNLLSNHINLVLTLYWWVGNCLFLPNFSNFGIDWS